jgi:hypothetical protein
MNASLKRESERVSIEIKELDNEIKTNENKSKQIELHIRES